MADIPGLIEGAQAGRAWARSFCGTSSARGCWCIWWIVGRERTAGSGKGFRSDLRELKSFGAGLEHKPMIMVASKIDVANKDKLAKLKRYCKQQNLELFPISAVTGKGIEPLKYAMAAKVEEVRRKPVAVSAADEAS